VAHLLHKGAELQKEVDGLNLKLKIPRHHFKYIEEKGALEEFVKAKSINDDEGARQVLDRVAPKQRPKWTINNVRGSVGGYTTAQSPRQRVTKSLGLDGGRVGTVTAYSQCSTAIPIESGTRDIQRRPASIFSHRLYSDTPTHLYKLPPPNNNPDYPLTFTDRNRKGKGFLRSSLPAQTTRLESLGKGPSGSGSLLPGAWAHRNNMSTTSVGALLPKDY